MTLYCPQCESPVDEDASKCDNCIATFTDPDGWQPVRTLPKKIGSIAGLITKLGIASVLIPAAGCIIGLLLSIAIPGCHCDEGAGCRGCGLNGLIATLMFGGLVGGIFAFLFVLPVSLVLAGIVAIFTEPRGKRV